MLLLPSLHLDASCCMSGLGDHVSTCRTASAPFQTGNFHIDDDTRNAGIPATGVKPPGEDPQEAEDS